jgi:hypothetical protein
MPVVDVSFRLAGQRIPADHGYLLYGALCQHVPSLHAPSTNDADPPSKERTIGLWASVAVHPVVEGE